VNIYIFIYGYSLCKKFVRDSSLLELCESFSIRERLKEKHHKE